MFFTNEPIMNAEQILASLVGETEHANWCIIGAVEERVGIQARHKNFDCAIQHAANLNNDKNNEVQVIATNTHCYRKWEMGLI